MRWQKLLSMKRPEFWSLNSVACQFSSSLLILRMRFRGADLCAVTAVRFSRVPRSQEREKTPTNIKMRQCPFQNLRLLKCLCKGHLILATQNVFRGSAASPRSLLEIQSLRPSPDLVYKNPCLTRYSCDYIAQENLRSASPNSNTLAT